MRKNLEVIKIVRIFASIKKRIMKLTKEEALKRFKDAMNRKKAWEEKFDAKYADVTNLYTTV